MKQIHQKEKEQFKTLFKQEHIDRINDRFKVLEVFLQTERHVTVEMLQELLKQQGHDFSTVFVRDTLRLLCRYGFAQKNKFDNGVSKYEHRHLGQHHDHMICTKCRKIFEFQNEELERLQARISAEHGFHMLQHKMEIYGICGKCLKDRTRLIPLDMAKPGERLAIIDIIGGANARMRLLTMGLKKGDEVEVITNNGQGQVVIAADYQRYALGRGLAQKIMVQTKSDPSIDAEPVAAPEPDRHSSMEDNTNSMPPVKLSELRQGQSGRIHKIGGAGALRRRLLEMGLLKGTRLYVEKYAPLKDPVELIVKGCHISLRVEEASNLLMDEVRQESADGSQAS